MKYSNLRVELLPPAAVVLLRCALVKLVKVHGVDVVSIGVRDEEMLYTTLRCVLDSMVD